MHVPHEYQGAAGCIEAVQICRCKVWNFRVHVAHTRDTAQAHGKRV